MAPPEYAYNIKTFEDALARANQKLQMYKMHKNALTKPTVAGIVPPLQSIASYTPFFPIAPSDLAKMNQTMADRLKELKIWRTRTPRITAGLPRRSRSQTRFGVLWWARM